MDTTIISLNEAIKLLPPGDKIHTFRNPAGMMIGCDWTREAVIDALDKSGEIQVTGATAQSMKHGLWIDDGGRGLFIEAANYDEANKP